jgi:hypothetical protein
MAVALCRARAVSSTRVITKSRIKIMSSMACIVCIIWNSATTHGLAIVMLIIAVVCFSAVVFFFFRRR